MRLELGQVQIEDIQFGQVSKIDGGVLYVNKEELIWLAKQRYTK